MKRSIKKTKTEIDTTKPVMSYEYTIVDSDCFGRFWNPKNDYCKLCADSLFCGIVFENVTKDAFIKGVEKKSGQFLDSFREPRKKFVQDLLGKIKAAIDANEPLTIQAVYEMFAEECRSTHKELIIDRLKKFLKENTFIYTQDSKFYIK